VNPGNDAGAAGVVADPVPARATDFSALVLQAPVFISDLHLSEDAPATLARFLRFVDHEARAFRELVILGDLLEFWAGDDELQGPDGVGRSVCAALHRYAASGRQVLLMQGNRDLLMGAGFARAASARLLGDPVVATIASGVAGPGDPAPATTKVLLAHGDAWCTDDLAYMAFRTRSRDERAQQQFLAQPLAQRKAFVGAVRSHSASQKRTQSLDIMDVNDGAVDAALRVAGTPVLVHGHTHRPAIHHLTVDGRPVLRCVLPDWDFDTDPPRGGYLNIHDGEPRIVTMPA
jgi:UDP-2,3-diacylglucosamine hydrolase